MTGSGGGESEGRPVGPPRSLERSVEDVRAVAAGGLGAGDGAACGAGDGSARGAGEEVVGGATGAQAEAPEDGPAGKNLCGDPIGASIVSDASRNSRVVGVEGSSRSAKGKAVSSKMTCLEMIIWLEDMSRQWYPLW
jgi:hypothetical protein